MKRGRPEQFGSARPRSPRCGSLGRPPRRSSRSASEDGAPPAARNRDPRPRSLRFALRASLPRRLALGRQRGPPAQPAPAPIPRALAKIWFAPPGLDYYPLKTTVQWLQWHLWHNATLGYHLTNVALHLLSALLLWRLLRQLGLRLAWLSAHCSSSSILGGAVESVAWIMEQPAANTLSLPPLLLAMVMLHPCDASEARCGGRRSSGESPARWTGDVAQRVGDNALHLYFWSSDYF